MRAAGSTLAVGLLLAAVPGLYLARGVKRGDRSALSPGPATPGHALMETACDQCHGANSTGGAASGEGRAADDDKVQAACVRCHGGDLAAEEDTHAASRFDDPSRAGDLALIDATRCAACHQEHRPHLADRQSVTVAADFCVACHKEVLAERASHRGLDQRGCAATGCHRYHDNRALYLELLKTRAGEPDLLADARVPVRAPAARPDTPGEPLVEVPAAGADPAAVTVEAATREWRASAHARVACAGCHQPPGAAAWAWRPAVAVCGRCHGPEQASFAAGKHGMRPALGLPPLDPRDAHLPMKATAHGRTLGCTSCHRDHAFDLRQAAASACEGCHDDGHTRAFRESKHFALWQREGEGQLAAGSGVSCATCHMPRAEVANAAGGVRVDHDQNRTLRPRDKMARAVCGRCHGLPFSLTALADDDLVARNFQGRPRSIRTGFDLVRGAGPATSTHDDGGGGSP